MAEETAEETAEVTVTEDGEGDVTKALDTGNSGLEDDTAEKDSDDRPGEKAPEDRSELKDDTAEGESSGDDRLGDATPGDDRPEETIPGDDSELVEAIREGDGLLGTVNELGLAVTLEVVETLGATEEGEATETEGLMEALTPGEAVTEDDARGEGTEDEDARAFVEEEEPTKSEEPEETPLDPDDAPTPTEDVTLDTPEELTTIEELEDRIRLTEESLDKLEPKDDATEDGMNGKDGDELETGIGEDTTLATTEELARRELEEREDGGEEGLLVTDGTAEGEDTSGDGEELGEEDKEGDGEDISREGLTIEEGARLDKGRDELEGNRLEEEELMASKLEAPGILEELDF